MSQPEHFFIIGAQRSGTTWLYQLLDQHPLIRMARPMRPEPKFFLDPARIAGGAEAYRGVLFPKAPANARLGEKGTSYIEHPEAAAIMQALLPGCKAIAILRDPVQRALSNYHFTKQHGLETRTLEEVFLENHQRPVVNVNVSVSPFDYLERGHYVHYLDPYRAAFGDRLLVVIFEELVHDITGLGKVHAHVGVPHTPPAERPQERVNASENSSVSAPTAVVAALQRYFAPHIRDMEAWLGRPIPTWHDPLQ